MGLSSSTLWSVEPKEEARSILVEEDEVWALLPGGGAACNSSGVGRSSNSNCAVSRVVMISSGVPLNIRPNLDPAEGSFLVSGDAAADAAPASRTVEALSLHRKTDIY